MRQHILRFTLILTLLLTSKTLWSQEKDVDWYKSQAGQAIDKDFYEKAIDILNQGKEAYPDEASFYRIAGQLYVDKKLHRLALNEFLMAEEIAPDDVDSIYQAAVQFGHISENEKSVEYFEKLQGDQFYGETIISDLAWMYYKTRKFKEGEALLLGELKESFDRTYAHTLGTIYTGLYDYENSKKYYLQAIENAEKTSSDYFQSIAYYNLSLLENSFYNYPESMKYTKKSLEAKERSSGHIAMARIQKQRLEFQNALTSLDEAEDLDNTPRSRISKGLLYTEFGSLSHAELTLKEVIKDRDRSWMYHFGTDAQEQDMRLSKMFMDIYLGLFKRQKFTLVSGPRSFFNRFYQRCRNYALYQYHRVKFNNQSLIFARKLEKAGSSFDADLNYMNAGESDRLLYNSYLKKAEDFEMGIAPEAEPYYHLERGIHNKNTEELQKALDQFHPEWEKQGMSRAYQALIPLLLRKGEKQKAYSMTARLYEALPGGVTTQGLVLPMSLRVKGEDSLKSRNIRRIRRWLMNSRNSFSKNPPPGTEYSLNITLTSPTEGFYSLNNSKGESILQNELKFVSPAKKDIVAALNLMIQDIYSPHSDGMPIP